VPVHRLPRDSLRPRLAGDTVRVPATTADIAGDGAGEVDRDGVGPPPGPAGAVLGALPVRSTFGPGEEAPSPAPPAPGEAAGDDPAVPGALLPGSVGKVPGGWAAG